MLLVLALIVGVLVGCIGIGGVLLPPVLAYVGGLDLHLATATSMWRFLFTGVVGTMAYPDATVWTGGWGSGLTRGSLRALCWALLAMLHCPLKC
jgi:uncharacterized membrane protein YfcA